MPRPPSLPPAGKQRLVLSILAGEMTVAAAARQAKVSEQSVGNWKRQFLEAGAAGLAGGSGKGCAVVGLQLRSTSGGPPSTRSLSQIVWSHALNQRCWSVHLARPLVPRVCPRRVT